MALNQGFRAPAGSEISDGTTQILDASVARHKRGRADPLAKPRLDPETRAGLLNFVRALAIAGARQDHEKAKRAKGSK